MNLGQTGLLETLMGTTTGNTVDSFFQGRDPHPGRETSVTGRDSRQDSTSFKDYLRDEKQNISRPPPPSRESAQQSKTNETRDQHDDSGEVSDSEASPLANGESEGNEAVDESPKEEAQENPVAKDESEQQDEGSSQPSEKSVLAEDSEALAVEVELLPDLEVDTESKTIEEETAVVAAVDQVNTEQEKVTSVALLGADQEVVNQVKTSADVRGEKIDLPLAELAPKTSNAESSAILRQRALAIGSTLTDGELTASQVQSEEDVAESIKTGSVSTLINGGVKKQAQGGSLLTEQNLLLQGKPGQDMALRVAADLPEDAVSKAVKNTALLNKAGPIVQREGVATAFADQTGRLLSPEVSSLARPSAAQSLNNGEFIQRFADQIAWFRNQNIQVAEMRLHPRDLGTIQVRIEGQGDLASVNFVAQNAAVKDVLDQNMTKLRELFTESGLDLVDVNVSDQSQQEAGSNEEADDGNPNGTLLSSHSDQDGEQVAESEIAGGSQAVYLLDFYI